MSIMGKQLKQLIIKQLKIRLWGALKNAAQKKIYLRFEFPGLKSDFRPKSYNVFPFRPTFMNPLCKRIQISAWSNVVNKWNKQNGLTHSKQSTIACGMLKYFISLLLLTARAKPSKINFTIVCHSEKCNCRCPRLCPRLLMQSPDVI